MPTVGNFNNDRILDGIKGLAGFPGGAVIKNLSVNAGDTGSIPGLGRSPGGEMQSAPVFLPGESHGQRSLAGYRTWDCKTMQLSMNAY